jgi:hypothetical protein
MREFPLPHPTAPPIIRNKGWFFLKSRGSGAGANNLIVERPLANFHR